MIKINGVADKLNGHVEHGPNGPAERISTIKKTDDQGNSQLQVMSQPSSLVRGGDIQNSPMNLRVKKKRDYK